MLRLRHDVICLDFGYICCTLINSTWRPASTLNLYVTHKFYSVASRVTKFAVFSSAFDLRLLNIYCKYKNTNCGRPTTSIFKLQITFIILWLDSPHLTCARQNFISNRLYFMLKLQKSNMAAGCHLEFLN